MEGQMVEQLLRARKGTGRSSNTYKRGISASGEMWKR